MIESLSSSLSSSSPLPLTKRTLVIPFLIASLLASLAATFHSTQINQFYDSSTQEEGQQHQPQRSPLPTFKASNYESQKRPHLPLKENPSFERNEFTFDSFRVGGDTIDLAPFGLKSDGSAIAIEKSQRKEKPPFELFEDFDLSSRIVGNETWVDLIGYRRDAEFTSLSFYVDKIARKRWLRTTTMDGMEAFVLKYGSELVAENENRTSREQEQQKALQKLLPVRKDYAAKPTHLSCAGGVWLTKTVGNTTFVGNGKKPFKKVPDFDVSLVAKDLAKQLQKVQESCGRRVPESLALRNTKPGIVVEERFTSWENIENDNRGGMEFKVFTIWGRMWLAVHRPGMDGAVAILRRDGTNLKWSGRSDPLPDWIDWPKIVAIAEKSGKNKDMFRTDIFVGIPAGESSLSNSSSKEDRLKSVRYVISESEIHPTEYFHVKGTKEIFDEGGRLWLAGYANGDFYRVVPNTEVPSAFVKHGMLPEDPALER
mmetsp:Transcript_27569/g.60688  ORF Transcript_27569/g.60688 Transcript_27569/m.60688 type:complete len:484 (-) Transcript_27569:145-1596(-)